jgi:hypothetical protein
MAITLETPTPPELMYMARGDDVDPFRPLFTGDVYKRRESGGNTNVVVVLQHPCALRIGGVDLVPNVLSAPLKPSSRHRSDWAKESMRVMPFPALEHGADFSADFVGVVLIPSADFATAWERIAILSELGVNLLVQRWVHHNSRVVIPTITYNAQTAGPFHEADLEAEWCWSLSSTTPAGISVEHDFHDWLRQPWSVDETQSRQEILDDPQKRAGVRRAMNAEIKNRLSALNSSSDVGAATG